MGHSPLLHQPPATQGGQAYHPGRCSLMRRVHRDMRARNCRRVGNFMGFRVSYVLGIISLRVPRCHSSRLRLLTERLQAWMIT